MEQQVVRGEHQWVVGPTDAGTVDFAVADEHREYSVILAMYFNAARVACTHLNG